MSNRANFNVVYLRKNCLYTTRLLSKLKVLDPSAKYLDFFQIETAIAWARKYHDGQFRKSGEPFYSHPIEVAYLISDYSLKTDVIVTSILHDIVEDTKVTIGMIVDEFGFRIAQMVDRLTRDRPDGTKFTVEEILNNAYLSDDKEVILVKLFDRWHNMQTIEVKSATKQKKEANETLKTFIAFSIYVENKKLENALSSICHNIVSSQEKIKQVSGIYDFLKIKDNYQLPSLGCVNKVIA